MKKLLILLTTFSLIADEWDDKSFWDFHPLHAGGNLIAIGDADVKIKNGSHDGQALFNKANVFTYFMLPISKCSFFMPRVEFNTFTMDWDKNPFFNEKHFYYMQFALTFYSHAVDTWRWIARADYNIDVKHFSSPGLYGLFSALIWGTHDIYDKWRLHVGAFGYDGFEGQQIYPVIGFDYTPNKKWFLQLVFPINYSIEYSLNERWKLSLKGRPLKERFRVGKLEPLPRSVFSYSTMGAELNLHYEKFLRLELEFFVGYNFGGNLYFKDRSGHQALYTKVETAPYGGLAINWGI